MTFRTDVLEVDDDDDADEPTLGVQNNAIIPLFLPKNVRKCHSNMFLGIHEKYETVNISLWDHGYKDICGTDHSNSKLFQK